MQAAIRNNKPIVYEEVHGGPVQLQVVGKTGAGKSSYIFESLGALGI